MPPDPPNLDESIRLLSHQLKAPLDAIRSLLDGITHGLGEELSPQVSRILERASKRAEEARQLVSDLLDYQALGDGKLDLAPVDAAVLIADVAAAYAGPAADKGITLTADLPDGVEVWVRADRRTLDQALRNLVDNAVKYTPTDGRVTVSAQADRQKKALTLSVTDTGPGIEAKDLDRLFEPFFRAVRHRGALEGTGLGLALARRIATVHGGGLEVRSTPGEGTTFLLTLPLERIEISAAPPRRRTRVVIVGGVTAGPKTAARLRRLDPEAEIIMIERSEFLSYTGCGLPAYVGGKVDTPRDLMSTADETLRSVRFFQSIKDVRVLSRTLVTEIDRAGRSVHCHDLDTGRRFSVRYDALVLATGARPVPPRVPGIDLPGIYSLYGIEGARSLRARLAAEGSLDVQVIGAGYIGVSLAESLAGAGARVTLLEREDGILANYLDPDMAARVLRVLTHHGVKVRLSSDVKRIRRDGERLVIETAAESSHADAIVLATGVSPESDLARRAGLALGPSGGIAVNEHLVTSDERIWAVGDCAESVNVISGQSEFLPLGSVSTRMGRVAADAIAGRPASFRGCLGTSMFRVFDFSVARTGLTQARAVERGFDAVSATVVGLDRPHYEPGATRMTLKVTAERSSGRILGAQGVGAASVVARVQILATAMMRGGRLEDVAETDLGYNPAFTTPIDLAQTACALLQAKMDGLVRTLTPAEMAQGRYAVVDVSPYGAYARHTIPGSVNVPLESLRREGIPFGRETDVLLCDRTSAGAYEAYRILRGRGWQRLWVLEGGTEEWTPRSAAPRT